MLTRIEPPCKTVWSALNEIAMVSLVNVVPYLGTTLTYWRPPAMALSLFLTVIVSTSLKIPSMSAKNSILKAPVGLVEDGILIASTLNSM